MNYERRDYIEFQERLAENDNALNLVLRRRPEHRGETCFQPNVWYGAVALGSVFLQQYPEIELARQPIDPEVFGDSPTYVQLAMAGIINSSLKPKNIDPTIPNIDIRPAKRINSCNAGELFFSETFTAMQQVGEDASYTPESVAGWDYITHDGELVAIQKRHKLRLTISLGPLALRGTPYPAGSIFRANISDITPPADDENTLITTDQITSMSFLRLGLHGAPADEQHQAWSDFGISVEKDDPIIWEMPRIRAVAQEAYGQHIAA